MDFEYISEQAKNGATLVGRTVIIYDEDRDTRICSAISNLPETTRRDLYLAHEHEGHILLVWKDRHFHNIQEIEIDGDVWSTENVGVKKFFYEVNDKELIYRKLFGI